MKKFFDWFFQQKHIESWFKWLEWVTLTAAIGAAYWETKSNWVLALVVLSFIYVCYAAITGVGYVFWSAFARYEPKKATIENISYVVGPIIGFGVFYVLTLVFIGILELGKNT
ncbi:hypothetical protein [Vibrio hepatarius]|uniref:Uncharacterized protein n=1 Tax=Vibrio hepatarius TaxID=171383 RepID=A0A0M0I5S0_9VIBR|nr:hypothetical protein [Vibrio hepatarius]KOO09676.1 hypothetical protein AKJ31_04810 [Vibrio hepatarius]